MKVIAGKKLNFAIENKIKNSRTNTSPEIIKQIFGSLLYYLSMDSRL